MASSFIDLRLALAEPLDKGLSWAPRALLAPLRRPAASCIVPHNLFGWFESYGVHRDRRLILLWSFQSGYCDAGWYDGGGSNRA
jgi:hypothetical protein